MKGATVRRAPYRLSRWLVGIMISQSALGLIFPGAYRDVGYVAGTWFGNDLVTLFLGAPLLLLGLELDRRGSTLGRLLCLGGLGYGFYNYAFYLFGAVLNVFFPLYALAVVVSAAALILLLASTDAARIAASFRSTTPRRVIGGYFVFVAGSLSVVWLIMWALHVFAGRPTPAPVDAFRLVAALDLTVMVPALAAGGALLWRNRPWGFVITSLAGIQGTLYLLLLALNSAILVARGEGVGGGELWMWGALAMATCAATTALLWNLRSRRRLPSPWMRPEAP